MTEPLPQVMVAGPVTQAERIASIDVLRGFAVLGILIMNIQSFSMIGGAYLNPTAYGDLTGVNHLVWLLSHVLADQKFMSIFSMLFGAGILLMTSRREAAGAKAAGVHYRRMGWLLLFGVAHAYLLWYGDILTMYALCGLLVYVFRRRRARTLIVMGLAFVAVGSALYVFFHFSMPHWRPEDVQEVQSYWQPSEDLVATELAAHRGGWLAQMPHRARTAFFFQTLLFLIYGLWRAGGLMLVGMGLLKAEVFGAKRSSALYGLMAVLGFVVGVPIILYGVHRNVAVEWRLESCFFMGTQFNYWGSLFVAMGWVGLAMLVCKHGWVPFLARALGAVGQMAFTNYLLQTVICTTIFYGHGFGLFGKVERIGQILIVFGVWIVLLVISPIWLRYFRFGPAEWLWRSLTYWQMQPMRRG